MWRSYQSFLKGTRCHRGRSDYKQRFVIDRLVQVDITGDRVGAQAKVLADVRACVDAALEVVRMSSY